VADNRLKIRDLANMIDGRDPETPVDIAILRGATRIREGATNALHASSAVGETGILVIRAEMPAGETVDDPTGLAADELAVLLQRVEGSSLIRVEVAGKPVGHLRGVRYVGSDLILFAGG
jgi:hypothetical protein